MKGLILAAGRGSRLLPVSATRPKHTVNVAGVPIIVRAVRALREAAVATVTRYPSLYAPRLKEALADYLGVAPDMVVTGCGSDDVLDSAIRAFCEPGERVAVPEPSSLAIAGLGALGMIGYGLRRRRAQA